MTLTVWCTTGAPINLPSPLSIFSATCGMNWMVTSSRSSFPGVLKITVTRHARAKLVSKVRGFTLNVRGSAVLNFETMKDNILAELDNTLDHRRTLDVVTPYYFQRDLENKRIKAMPRVKQYGLVFDKRVIQTNTKSSYPYGYKPPGGPAGARPCTRNESIFFATRSVRESAWTSARLPKIHCSKGPLWIRTTSRTIGLFLIFVSYPKLLKNVLLNS